MSLDRKNASGIVPRAAVLVAGVTLAAMPTAASAAVMPPRELRPMHRPVEVRTRQNRR